MKADIALAAEYNYEHVEAMGAFMEATEKKAKQAYQHL
jgi:hypothetical protein